MQEKGSGIHHLTYTVENIKVIVKEMEKEGIVPLSTIDIEWENLIESDFTNPNASKLYIILEDSSILLIQVCMMDQ